MGPAEGLHWHHGRNLLGSMGVFTMGGMSDMAGRTEREQCARPPAHGRTGNLGLGDLGGYGDLGGMHGRRRWTTSTRRCPPVYPLHPLPSLPLTCSEQIPAIEAMRSLPSVCSRSLWSWMHIYCLCSCLCPNVALVICTCCPVRAEMPGFVLCRALHAHARLALGPLLLPALARILPGPGNALVFG